MIIMMSNGQAQGMPTFCVQSRHLDNGTNLINGLLGSLLSLSQPPVSTSSFLSCADHVKALAVLILDQI